MQFLELMVAGMLRDILPLLTRLVLDSIISLLYRSNRSGRGLWDYLPLAPMRISMRLVLPNPRLGFMMGWASWEFGSIPYVVSWLPRPSNRLFLALESMTHHITFSE
jgi:hypothetical protein